MTTGLKRSMRQGLSLLLTLVLVLALLPGFIIPASAVEYDETLTIDGSTVTLFDLWGKLNDAINTDGYSDILVELNAAIDGEGLSWSSPISIPDDTDVTITFEATGGDVTLKPENGNRHMEFDIGPDATLTLIYGNVTLDGNYTGTAQGGIRATGDGRLSLDNAVIQNCYAGSGGGVYADSDISAVDSTFSGNEAENNGGGAYSVNGNVVITSCTFLDNAATYGGGVMAYDGNITIDKSTFKSNTATSGGGIYSFSESGTVTISGSEVLQNVAFYGGGLYLYYNSSTAKIIDSLFDGNIAAELDPERGSGGGIYAGSFTGTPYGTITIQGSAFTGNTANTQGGGIMAFRHHVAIDNSQFAHNKALSDSGGGLYAQNGDVTIAQSAFSSNASAWTGGGVYASVGALTVSDSIFSGNTAVRQGGGVYSFSGEVEIESTAFLQNSTDSHGGAFYKGDLSKLTLGAGNSFSGNLASAGYWLTAADETTYASWDDITPSEPFNHIVNNFDLGYLPVGEDAVYVILFYNNDGTSGEYHRSVLDTDPLGNRMPSAPSRAGYRFISWDTEPDGGDEVTSGSLFDADRNIKVYARWVPLYWLTVTAGTGGTADQDVGGEYAAGDTVTLSATANSGYRFVGWTTSGGGTFVDADSEITAFTMPPESVTVTANFIRTGGTTPSGGGTITYTVRFESNGGSNVSSQSVERNAKAAKPTDPTREGYAFTGWYTTSALNTRYDFNTAVTSSFTLYAGWEETGQPGPEPQQEDHPAYISGYPDGTFHPDNILTRAEAASLLYGLVTEGHDVELNITGFSDVPESTWYYEAVMALANLGIVSGRGLSLSEDEPVPYFAPESTITRAEFLTMALRFAGIDAATPDRAFADVPAGHWAAGYIMAAVESGMVGGYGDGTFRPERTITRAEAVSILNRMLGCEGLPEGNTFSDVPATHWAFEAITAAATEHTHQ